MFDLASINRRYWELKLKVVTDLIVDGVITKVEKETVLEIEPPTKKMLNKIVKLRSGKEEDTMDDLYEATSMILNKNKTGKKISDETIEKLNYDEINGIITKYFEWLGNTQNSPN